MSSSNRPRFGAVNAVLKSVSFAISTMVVGLGTSACSASLATPIDGWVVVETEHVRLRAEMPQAEAQELASEMQQIRDAFASKVLNCGFQQKAGLIEATAIPQEQFERIGPTNSAGYFRKYGAVWVDYPPQIVLPTSFQSSSRQVYQHELTHWLNALCFPSAPVWLDEGLAKLLETAVVGKNQISIGLPAFLFVSRNEGFQYGDFQGMEIQIIPRNFVPSASELLSLDRQTFYSRSKSRERQLQAIGNYAAAWSLIHMLELGDQDLKLRFARYINALHSGQESPDAVWKEEFDHIDLNARLAAYRDREQLPYFDIAYQAPARTPPKVRKMPPGEAHLHWTWLLGPTDKIKAREHLTAALADPSTNALARAMAAGMYAQDDQFAEADIEVQKGLVAHPTDAHLLHAQLQLEMTGRNGSSNRRALEQGVNELRSVARTAEQLNAVARGELMIGNAEAALDYSQRALAERRECWPCLVTRAGAQAKLERWSEALESLEHASRWISHDNPEAFARINELKEQVRRRSMQK